MNHPESDNSWESEGSKNDGGGLSEDSDSLSSTAFSIGLGGNVAAADRCEGFDITESVCSVEVTLRLWGI